MESPASLKSKKRVFPGSSSSFNDPDVVEIKPPTNWSSNSKSKSIKRKEVTSHCEVIYIDSDDDAEDVAVINKKGQLSNNNMKQQASLAKQEVVGDNNMNLFHDDGSFQTLYLSSPQSQQQANMAKKKVVGDNKKNLFHDDGSFQTLYLSSSQFQQQANLAKKKVVGDDKKNLFYDDAHTTIYLSSASGTSLSYYYLDENPFPSSSLSLQTQESILPEKILDTAEAGNSTEISTAFQSFKQFDTVEDHSDHHFSKSGSSNKQQPKSWAKKIQEEWKILEKDLPDAIFVRVYESRMDLLRAVIIGAQGTPYHDGLFFFDVFFPSCYPSVPPLVHYHSGGLRINPNLYACGKVCLSLLNTWTGSANEKWIPNVSTMLQVLVSIQALILNEKPYFNEPGWASSAGSASGERQSKQYSENAFLLSLKTMVFTMRRPPMHFREFALGHFLKNAQNILGACEAYIEKSAPVGSVIIDGAQNEKTKGRKKKCSKSFPNNLSTHITMLAEALRRIGAKDCDKFLPLAEKGK